MNITLKVADTRISVNRSIFLEYPDTMLGRMFSSSNKTLTHPNENGEYEVAKGISAIVFKAILGYYETGVIHCPSNLTVSELRHACDYFMIPFNIFTIRSNNMKELLEELSDEVARKPFEKFFQEKILPSVDTTIKGGDRVCRIFVLEKDCEDFLPNYRCEESTFHFGNKNVYTLLDKNKENRDIFAKVFGERGFQEPFLQKKEQGRYYYEKTETSFSVNRFYVELSWVGKVQQ